MLISALLSFAISGSLTQSPGEWQPPIPLPKLHQAKAALVPFPREVVWGKSDLRLQPIVELRFDWRQRRQLQPALDSLAIVLKECGIDSAVRAGSKAKTPIRINLEAGAGKSREGYRLSVDAKGIEIIGNGEAGAYYAVQTLRQMIRPEGGKFLIQHALIEDSPAFAWRGFMHDTGRNFQEVSELKRQIELASRFKVNLFHWHLTDNPAWRVESRIYPQLNNPVHRIAGRDERRTYSFQQIREVIAFARRHQVRILPELDMPGHSQFFKPAMGYEMGSPEGIVALKKLIEEFCREIPKESCPWLHVGSDEVRIPDPVGFMREIGSKVESLGRVPVIWSPGLANTGAMIEQPWTEEYVGPPKKKTLDSSIGYANFYDPLLLVQRYYFAQPCGVPMGGGNALGSVMCVWPDVRVDDKRDIERHNGVWPGMLAMAEGAWVGRPSSGRAFLYEGPNPDSLAGISFHEFEGRLARLRDKDFARISFPYALHSRLRWKVWLDGSDNFKTAYGGSVLISDATHTNGMFRDADVDLAHAETVLHADRPRTIHAWIGFETSARSNRKGSGVPPQGKWDPFGALVTVNDLPIAAPNWRNPGAHKFLRHTWHQPPNEIPFTDEELFWTREPVRITLRKGANRIRLRIPRGYPIQTWQFAFVPVRRSASGRWVEDLSLKSTLP